MYNSQRVGAEIDNVLNESLLENKINDSLEPSWIDKQMKQFPTARRDVLTFINDLCNVNGKYPDSIRAIELLFSSGYCYYFAKILEDAFGGNVCWHKGYSHIVWMDENSVCYEIYGVFYDYGEDDIVPISELGEGLESFRHRGKDVIK